MQDYKGLVLEYYQNQKPTWPNLGKSITGQFTENSVIVYQAYKSSIADPAITHQNFTTNNPDFLPKRMTWIKPNFLWMMFRSNWGQSKNQERTLAFRVRLEWFLETISQAKLSGKHKNCKSSDVVVQWDPDHSPGGAKNSLRRDIQIGIRNSRSDQWAAGTSGPAIIEIIDITELVQRAKTDREQSNDFLMPLEQEFEYKSENIDLI